MMHMKDASVLMYDLSPLWCAVGELTVERCGFKTVHICTEACKAKGVPALH